MMAATPAAAGSSNLKIATGMDYLRQGDIRQAIKSFDEAIKENPKDVQGYMILGQTYMHMKEYNRAIDTLTVATQVAPDNGQAHYLLATNFGLAGNYSMARVQAQRSAEIFRKNQDENNFKRSVALLQGLPQSGSQVPEQK
jgi:Tfp pilus assembly protein PilF